jgi:lipopolysaccharide/colanic/teichoic acid biosynthesis glycosyltransferase
LTGLAQANGRNSLSWEEKFAYDLEYVENLSFLLDVKILMKTVQTVLMRKDIGTRGKATLMDFDAYRKQQQEENHVYQG